MSNGFVCIDDDVIDADMLYPIGSQNLKQKGLPASYLDKKIEDTKRGFSWLSPARTATPSVHGIRMTSFLHDKNFASYLYNSLILQPTNGVAYYIERTKILVVKK